MRGGKSTVEKSTAGIAGPPGDQTDKDKRRANLGRNKEKNGKRTQKHKYMEKYDSEIVIKRH
ncbi:hypothetical protein L484_004828 [Morus notabilis]|uniref:Uncharacterized protein n=1 Tax=Morus notabilis TaxID=981085 RepID=W9SUF4_9ROSA|nr:hypothetical protein L484_004828 [Morus notabilis]